MPTSDPCILDNTEAAIGHATQLGAITWAHESVNLCSNSDGADVDGCSC
jgi:hypothetical protein